MSADPTPHVCDSGWFDRTICPPPCGAMHSYCDTCGKRQDPCPHDETRDALTAMVREGEAAGMYATDHGAAGFCGNHGQAVDDETARLRYVENALAHCRSAGASYRSERDAARAALDRVRAEGWADGHRVGWEHCQDGNYGTDWHDDDTPNPYCAALDAEEPR